ncbi:MAG: hypothetical protein WC648_04105 [Candidatus Paceibacterota bacterium]|jgi:hypothetical protein
MEIIIGILLSTLISALSPIIEKYSTLTTNDAKKLLVAILALVAAIVFYFMGEDFAKSFGIVLASAAVYYEYIYRLVIQQVSGEKPIETYFNKILSK